MAKSICDYVSTDPRSNVSYSLTEGNMWCLQTPEMAAKGKAKPLPGAVFIPDGELVGVISGLSGRSPEKLTFADLSARFGNLDYASPECRRGYILAPASGAVPYAQSSLLERKDRIVALALEGLANEVEQTPQPSEVVRPAGRFKVKGKK